LLVAAQAAMWAHAQQLEPGWLTESEQARLASIQKPPRRQEFVACRYALRSLLANATTTAVEHWGLDAPEGRAPRLSAQHHGAHAVAITHLALSHSGKYLACAVAAQPVGVDIEVDNYRSSRRDPLALAAIACSACEVRQLHAADCEQSRRRMFVQWWSLKEAYFKCIGTGVDFSSVQRIECRLAQDGAARVLAHGRSWSGKTTLGQYVVLSACSLDRSAWASALAGGAEIDWRGQSDWVLVAR
jgi:4'-phosphopantetheinyl transferase